MILDIVSPLGSGNCSVWDNRKDVSMYIFPYSNFHELNLDWIIDEIKKTNTKLVDFVKLNTIKYANPLQWDITHQYEQNTVVIDDVTGYAYLSVQPVPAGVSVDNTTYWTPIFNVFTIYEQIKDGVAYNNRNVDTSLYDIPANGLVWVNQKLYKATKAIGKGDRFTSSNTVETTVENELRSLLTKVSNNTGDISNLTAEVNDIAKQIGAGVRNVKYYGAKGDGVTDDSAAFKAQLAAEGVIIVPAGSYKLDNFDISDPVKIISVGKIISPVVFRGETTLIGGDYVRVDCIGCTVNINGISAINPDLYALKLTECHGSVSSCYSEGENNDTCTLYKCSNLHITGCTFVAHRANKIHCLQVRECSDTTVSNCAAINGGWFGYSVYFCDRVTLTGCTSRDSVAEGVNLENSNQCTVSNCSVSWADGKSDDFGISIFGNNDNAANNNLITGCTVYNCAQSGIDVGGNAVANIVTNNNILAPNAKNKTRLYAMGSTQLEGYTGRPGENTFKGNYIVKGTYTEGLFQTINPVSTMYVIDNWCNVSMPAGTVDLVYYAGNHQALASPSTLPSVTNGTAESAYIEGISATQYLLYATIKVATAARVTFSVPSIYLSNNIFWGMATQGDDTQLIFSNDGTTFFFDPKNTGPYYVRAVITLKE